MISTESQGLTESRFEPVCGMDSWFPVPATLKASRRENFNTITIDLEIADEGIRDQYHWSPGQFNMLYMPGIGEAAISISSNPEEPRLLKHTIRVVGSVTRAIEKLQPGDSIGLRGPFGRGWPMDELVGRDVVLVAGGIGLAPIRPVVYRLLRHRKEVGRVILLFGCRSPEDRVYAEELEEWTEHSGIDCLVTVDNATPGWVGPVGVVTNLLQRIRVNAENTTVMVCGPRVLNRVAAWNFLQLHVPNQHVYISLERNMNCGFGRCGHCQYGSKFVCKDGPVFSYAEVANIFSKEEI